MCTDMEQSPRLQDIVNGKKVRCRPTSTVCSHLYKARVVHTFTLPDHVWKDIQTRTLPASRKVQRQVEAGHHFMPYTPLYRFICITCMNRPFKQILKRKPS